MEKLDSKEITVDEAKAQAALAKQANNGLKYEIERTKLLIQLEQHKNESTDSKADFRKAAGSNFKQDDRPSRNNTRPTFTGQLLRC